MKILAISIIDKDGQTVFYNDDAGEQKSRVTPLIGEDGQLFQWMKDNPLCEVTVSDDEPETEVNDPFDAEIKDDGPETDDPVEKFFSGYGN